MSHVAEVQKVFDYWVERCRSNRKSVKLTDARKRIISRALKDYDLETCLEAIDGVLLSNWHMGNNPRGKRYDDITLILRDAQHIEDFSWDAQQAAEGKDSFLSPGAAAFVENEGD